MNKGFTLIELILVTAILAGLASIVMFSFPGATAKARDSRRREELQQFRISLEVFANRNNGTYPIRATAVQPSAMCGSGLPFGNIDCPNDPRDGDNVCEGGACRYQYLTDNPGGTTTTTYVLYGRLENPADNAEPCFVICANGLSGEAACPTSSACTL